MHLELRETSMDLSTSIIFYLLAGAGTSLAVYITTEDRASTRLFPLVAALFFWPLFLPLIAGRGSDIVSEDHVDATAAHRESAVEKRMAAAIEQVESELDRAIIGLEDWAHGLTDQEKSEIRDLTAAWRTQAERICELDRLLSHPDIELPGSDFPEETSDDSLVIAGEEVSRSAEELRRANIEQYTGAPMSRVSELIAQIIAAGENTPGSTNVPIGSEESRVFA